MMVMMMGCCFVIGQSTKLMGPELVGMMLPPVLVLLLLTDQTIDNCEMNCARGVIVIIIIIISSSIHRDCLMSHPCWRSPARLLTIAAWGGRLVGGWWLWLALLRSIRPTKDQRPIRRLPSSLLIVPSRLSKESFCLLAWCSSSLPRRGATLEACPTYSCTARCTLRYAAVRLFTEQPCATGRQAFLGLEDDQSSREE
ncbi:hypothetical protein IWX48DRAFT_620471 [Phyllosticta citricarpa]